MKRCCKCQEQKIESDFAKNKFKSDGLQTLCRDCKKAVDKLYYQENRDKMRRQISESKKRNLIDNYQKLFQFFKSNPCVDCGETDPFVLEFDHQGDKLSTVSKLISCGYIWKSVLKEISKCQVRCANCHKRKTAKEFFRNKLKYCCEMVNPERIELS